MKVNAQIENSYKTGVGKNSTIGCSKKTLKMATFTINSYYGNSESVYL